jgi:hypothetical protein
MLAIIGLVALVVVASFVVAVVVFSVAFDA